MSGPDEFDIAVIGGGLVGAAIAYGLVRLGKRVVMLDEGDIALRALARQFRPGLGAGQGARPGAVLQLDAVFGAALAGAGGAAARGCGCRRVALEQPGGFHLCLSERELEQRVQTLTRLVAQPGLEQYPFEVLDHAALAERIPGIGSAVVGATYTLLDGHVNALRLFRALHAAFVALGGNYRANHGVDRIATQR